MSGASAAGSAVPRRVVLEPGAIHVWRAGLEADQTRGVALPRVLSGEERARARGYRFDADRRRFSLARSLLRLLLAAYVEVPAAALRFDTTCAFCGAAHGKPRLIGSGAAPPAFSLSYTDDAVLLAVSAAGPIGVDIETVPKASLADILAAAAAPSEARALQALPSARRRRALIELWTLKEAVVKATGHGLAVDLRSLELADLGSRPRVISPPEQCPEVASWWLQRLPGSERHAAALAAATEPLELQVRDLGGFAIKD